MWAAIVVIIIAIIIAVAYRPKGPPPPSPQQATAPEPIDGRVIRKVYGTVWIKKSNGLTDIGWRTLGADPIKSKGGK